MRRLVFISWLLAHSVGGQDLVSYQQAIPQTSVHFDMVAIPSGSFKQGQTKKVQVPAFWMAKTEVTYDAYQLFFEESRDPEPKPPKEGPDAITRPSPPYIDFTLGMGKVGGFPANSMQQYAAIMYCKWLYAKTGIFYRLPTELEWEYASQAGQEIPNEKLTDYAWVQENASEKYHQVGLKKPNAWGLHDMLGNVSEWVLDHFDGTNYPGKNDPVYIDKYADAVVRGGNYQDSASRVRLNGRMAADPIWNRRDPQIPKSIWWNADAPFVGFRIVRPAKQPTKQEINAFFEKYL